jgi:hypothetical protein
MRPCGGVIAKTGMRGARGTRRCPRAGVLIRVSYGHTILDMARVTIRATYALDVETVRALENMATRLGISKSEALRRAIQSAAGEVPSAGARTGAALDDLQRSLGLTRGKADAWARRVRAERHSGSARREPRRG